MKSHASTELDAQMPSRQPEEGEPDGQAGYTWLAFAVALVAILVRSYRANSQLWIDEISALTGSIRRPFGEILSQWPGTTTHILYEVLAHLCTVLFGESPLSIRLPAIVFGVAGVAAVWALVRGRFEQLESLAVTALFAVSYHHVFYSQNARGYTALMFFFLVSTALLDRFVRTRKVSRSAGAWYAVTGALCAYSVPFGLVVLPGHLLAVISMALVVGGVRPAAASARPFPLRPILLWNGAGLLFTAVLYLPFIGDILRFAAERSALPSEGARLSLPFVLETLEGLGAGLGGTMGLVVVALVGVVGLAVWLRRAAFLLIAMLAPLVLELAVFLALGSPIHPRYFAVALPLVYGVGGIGLVTVLSAGLSRLPASAGMKAGVQTAVVAGIVAASAFPLLAYYRYPKQDYLGAIEVVDSMAQEGDLKVGVDIAGYVIQEYYGADYASVETYQELLVLEESSDGQVWLVTTLERVLSSYDPELFDHIQSSYTRVDFLPGTLGDGGMRVYRGAAPPDA